ncbi:MAG TPA: GNAT family N-acetyltransferase [Thermoplasmata archaeon]|nr:GNAT family N-acetyltransferase [Thermoplasmata archaeon]
MAPFTVRELGPETWPDFVRIIEKHHGVWGGCWCLTFHLPPGHPVRDIPQRRALKEDLVRTHRAHAALVYDGADIVGWCQFGPPAELPGRATAYGRLGIAPPDWRLPCFFVDRGRRGEGVARKALEAALWIIAARGGGIVDGYPQDLDGRRTSNSFLWGGTASMFQAAGFSRVAQLGPTKWIVRCRIRPRGRDPPRGSIGSGVVVRGRSRPRQPRAVRPGRSVRTGPRRWGSLRLS